MKISIQVVERKEVTTLFLQVSTIRTLISQKYFMPIPETDNVMFQDKLVFPSIAILPFENKIKIASPVEVNCRYLALK